MDVHRLRSVIELVRSDYEAHKIPQRFNQMMESLQAYANSPNPETAKAYSTRFEELRQALTNSQVRELLPLQRRILSEVGGSAITGTELIEQIRRAQEQSTTPADILSAIQPIHAQFNKFLKSITQLVAHFDSLNIRAYQPQAETQEISIILPDRLTKRDITEIERLFHKWGHAIGRIQEVVTGKASPVRVAALDEGSVVLVIGTIYSVAFATLRLVNSCLDTYERILTLRQKHIELKKLKVSKTTLESLKSDERQLAEQGVENITADFLKQFAGPDLGGRSAPEREALVRATVQFVLKQIDQGVEVEVLLPPPAERAPEEKESPTKPSKQSVEKELKASSDAWRSLPREDSPILELPEPELDGAALEQANDAADSSNGETLHQDTDIDPEHAKHEPSRAN